MDTFVPYDSNDDGGIRILHVDDDPGFAELFSDMVPSRDESIEVVSASSAEAALDRLADRSVDCVVSDYQMPGMDGLELLEAVRDEHGDLPFILFTGKGSEEIASEAIGAGVNGYLQKRGTVQGFDMLVQRVRNVVEKYRTQRQLRDLKRRYEKIAKSATDALWDWSIQGDRVSMDDTVRRSSGYYRTFGYDPDEVSDELEWWADRIHPEDRDDAIAALDETLANGEEFYEDTHRFRRADGSYTEVLSRGYVEYEDGEPVWMVGSIIDSGEPATD